MKKHSEILIVLFLITITFVLFFQVHQFNFIGFDDNEYVYENPNVTTGISFENIRWAFTKFHSNNWHPLTWISHMLDCQIFGLNPGWHHLINLFFHLANAILLFFVFKKMTGGLWQSALLSVVFAIHPLHVESVAWVSERKDVLSTFFFILTLLAYIRYVRKPVVWRYLSVIVLFILGLLSKPMVVTLPCVLVLLDYWPLNRFKSKSLFTFKKMDSALYLLMEKLPLFAFAFISCLLTYYAQKQGGIVKSFDSFPLKDRIANAMISYVSYIGKMAYPNKMAFLYPYPEVFPWWKVSGACMILGVISFLAVKNLKNRPFIIVGWLWYIGTLVPVIGLIQVGLQPMADRYMYIPMVGLLIIISWGFSEIIENFKAKSRILTASVVVLISLLAIVSWKQIAYWDNTIKMLEHTVQVTKNNYTAHHILGANLSLQDKSEDAIKNYLKVVKINPKYHDSYFNLGNEYSKLGKIDQAIYYHLKAAELKPNYAQSYCNLGALFFQKKNYEKVVKNYLKAIKLEPGRVDAHFNLGVIYHTINSTDKAIQQYTKAINIQPDFAEAYFYLGCAYYKKGHVDGAVSSFQKALLIKPDYDEAHEFLKIILSLKSNLKN